MNDTEWKHNYSTELCVTGPILIAADYRSFKWKESVLLEKEDLDTNFCDLHSFCCNNTCWYS